MDRRYTLEADYWFTKLVRFVPDLYTQPILDGGTLILADYRQESVED
jgi:hypothetical protein